MRQWIVNVSLRTRRGNSLTAALPLSMSLALLSAGWVLGQFPPPSYNQPQAQYPQTQRPAYGPRGPQRVAARPAPVAEDESTQIVAIVGDLPIFAGDVLPLIRQSLDPHRDQLSDSQYEQQKQLLMKQAVKQRIDVKMVYLEFLRAIPTDKREEALANIKEQLDERFYTDQMPKLLEATKAASLAELNAVLQQFGSSIAQRKAEFREQMIAQTTIFQNVERNREITHDELLKHYYDRVDEYSFKAKVRFEKLTARYDKFPNRAAADYAIRDMGNRVIYGANFAQVARQFSNGSRSDSGGYYDWTDQGALVSNKLDQAVFTLPLNKMSDVIEDVQGFHIVRVLERVPAGRKSFVEVQADIKKELQSGHFQSELAKYLEKVRERTYVWTKFDYGDDSANDS